GSVRRARYHRLSSLSPLVSCRRGPTHQRGERRRGWHLCLASVWSVVELRRGFLVAGARALRPALCVGGLAAARLHGVDGVQRHGGLRERSGSVGWSGDVRVAGAALAPPLATCAGCCRSSQFLSCRKLNPHPPTTSAPANHSGKRGRSRASPVGCAPPA